MRYWHFCKYLLLLFSASVSLHIFSQNKTVVKDTIIEEIIYEYDTIYIDDTKLRIDTLYFPKPVIFRLPSNSIKPIQSNAIQKYPLHIVKYDSLIIFISSEFSGYTSINNFEKTKSISNNILKYDKKVFPKYSLTAGVKKGKFFYAINAEYGTYCEVLEHEKPITWKDTLDNKNEIFYRNISGQYKSIITNQYSFLHFNLSFGYYFEKKLYYILPQLILGAGFNFAQKNFYYDDSEEQISEIPSKNKAGNYGVAGIQCQVGYTLQHAINIYLNPSWHHCFIKTIEHPLGYRDIIGLGLGVSYSFNLKTNTK
jgi:hypothetical protein